MGLKWNHGQFALLLLNGWLVVCFGFNGPLRQFFSLYPAGLLLKPSYVNSNRST